MSREEALAALKAIKDRQVLNERGYPISDVEADHGQADDILIALIDDAEVREVYESIRKWYA